MKSLAMPALLALVSLSAQAKSPNTGSWNCQVRTSQGAEPVLSKTMLIDDIVAFRSINIGTVEGSRIDISSVGFYNEKLIFSLSNSSAAGSQTAVGAAENVLQLVSSTPASYLNVLCREAVLE